MIPDPEEQRERDLETTRAETERRIDALPLVFQQRIAKFQRDGGHVFDRDYLSYELFCCEQAVVIAHAMKTEAGILSFQAENWPEQKRLVPDLDDGHSGNTFGMAVRLAYEYVVRPEFVLRLHGALTPLVGCEAYGCKHEETA